MDLKQAMQEIEYGAMHLSDEERTFFYSVLATYRQHGRIAEAHAPHVLDLYRKIKLRNVDGPALLADLEANSILLGSDEQSRLIGARMALEYDSGYLTPETVEALLKIRQALSDRQHNTLAGRGAGIAARAPARPAPLTLPVLPAPAPRRSSRHPAPLGKVSALSDAAKLLKKGR